MKKKKAKLLLILLLLFVLGVTVSGCEGTGGSASTTVTGSAK